MDTRLLAHLVHTAYPLPQERLNFTSPPMTSNRAISETFPDSSEPQAPSPFSAASEPAPAPSQAEIKPMSSPFIGMSEPSSPPSSAPSEAAAPQKLSPFTVVDDDEERPMEACRPAILPKKRKPQSPFQIAESNEAFGAMPGIPVNPWDTPYAAQPSPFSVAGSPPDYAAFAAAQQAHAYAQHFAPQHPYAQPPFPPHANYPYPAPYTPPYPPHYPAPPYPNHFAPHEMGAPPPAQNTARNSDSSAVRQVELRAIFGVDREMNVDEILDRCRSLPGIRSIACLGGQEASTIESLRTLVTKLGYGNGALRIYAGESPVEFIREANVLLAVQTEGGFSAGVREILMVAAREMAHLM